MFSGIWLKWGLHVLSQSTSEGFTSSPLPTWVILFKVCIIETTHWVKVLLYKFIAVLHGRHSFEYLTCQVNFSDSEGGQCNDCWVQVITN